MRNGKSSRRIANEPEKWAAADRQPPSAILGIALSKVIDVSGGAWKISLLYPVAVVA